MTKSEKGKNELQMDRRQGIKEKRKENTLGQKSASTPARRQREREKKPFHASTIYSTYYNDYCQKLALDVHANILSEQHTALIITSCDIGRYWSASVKT